MTKKKEKGITLIALVVTIVVLLILAGISISMLTGENGVITQANKSSVKNDNGTVLETIELKIAEYKTRINEEKVTDRLEQLEIDGIIDEQGVVNCKTLVGQKLKTGNGSDYKDVYVIENGELYYYDKKGNKDYLGDIGSDSIAKADISLFDITEDGVVSIKEEYYEDYGSDECYRDLEWKNWTIEELTIPSEINGIKVEKIADSFLSLNYIIKKVNIPSTVKYIGEQAFYSCGSLISIKIPNTVINIGLRAFDSCSSLEEVKLSKNLTSIEEGVFYECRSLTNITIPDSVTSIGDDAFAYCRSLTSITIPDSVTNIGYHTFYDTPFDDNLPDEEIYLGKVYYEYRGDMSENTIINIKYGTTGIGGGAFSGCRSLTSITIPDSVTSIGYGAFRYCSSLTSITIPDSVTSIEGSAFSGCSSLTSITIPDSVTSIGWYAFYGCSNLTSIVVSEGNNVYDSRNNCNAIIETSTNKLICGCNTTIIPDSVTSIGGVAFSGRSSLTSITIPGSVTSIEGSAFSGCSSLTSITIPDSVTSIGSSAFSGCSSLTSITIPDSVTSIEWYALGGCSSLTSITIPDSVTSIESSAFSGCRSLTSITIPDSVTSIESSAFSGCSSLTSITIPDSVTSIESWAFDDCSSLTSITIPDSVTSIGSGAFYGCSSLTTVNYTGTKEQWNKISISSYNSSLTNATKYYGYKQ